MSAPISPYIAFRLRSVGDPSISADGSTLVYSLSWFEADSLESRSRIMLLNLSTGKEEEFTNGQKDSAPRFAPDGRTVGFLRRNDGQESQVWLLLSFALIVGVVAIYASERLARQVPGAHGV